LLSICRSNEQRRTVYAGEQDSSETNAGLSIARSCHHCSDTLLPRPHAAKNRHPELRLNRAHYLSHSHVAEEIGNA
jgi:hypothetical protein